MGLIVSKFGGTSMGDATAMRRSAEIVLRQNSFLVVVSATSGTTNQLIELGQLAQQQSWDQCETLLNSLFEKHNKISADLGSDEDADLRPLFEELTSLIKGIHLLKECTPRAMDAVTSLGERMSSLLFTKAMNQYLKLHKDSRQAVCFDVREVIITNNDFGKAVPLTEVICQLAKEKILTVDCKKKIIVTQGFIGKNEDGLTTTLGRGGSDYSAAILAEAVSAEILEIWTDVAGIATTDPRICSEARSLIEISFKEASELATFGAKVLHPATLEPAMRKNIPVYVGSSFDLNKKGTWIKKEVSSAPLMRALALRKKQVLVTLTTPKMLHSHGFLFNIFNVFNANKISIDAITTSEISVCLTLDDATLLNKKLIQELSQFAEVQIEENLSLISLIGNNINHTPGLANKIFESIPDINVRMICLGASRHNFCFLVSDSHGVETIQRLHKNFSLDKQHE